MANFNFLIVFYSIRVTSLMVVKSTASTVPPKCQSYNILYRISILIGIILINMFIVKSKQISCSSLKYPSTFVCRNWTRTLIWNWFKIRQNNGLRNNSNFIRKQNTKLVNIIIKRISLTLIATAYSNFRCHGGWIPPPSRKPPRGCFCPIFFNPS